MQGIAVYRKAAAYGAVAVIVALLLSQLSFVRSAAETLYEDISLAAYPSAQRAYLYGNKHFDATHADAYNISRAEDLYERATLLDPKLPYLQHQRARVAFLKGDFSEALHHINDELAVNPEPSPSSYYIRGLIKGFIGEHASAAADYEAYLQYDPTNWAAINDLAWVLLKDKRSHDALVALDWGLIFWPENPWLLNGKAIAHYEMGQLELAAEAATRAEAAVEHVTEADWLQAYPGNDPLMAREGVATLRAAVQENIHNIALAREEASKDVQ